MIPPKIIYLLFALGWSGFILWVLHYWPGQRKWAVQEIVIACLFASLSVYFSYFAGKRLKYDPLGATRWTVVVCDTDVPKRAAIQLLELQADRSLKIKVKLLCRTCQQHESFSLRFLDQQNEMILEELFAPALGRFRFESVFLRTQLPLKIVLSSSADETRWIKARVSYAYIPDPLKLPRSNLSPFSL